MSEIVKIPIYDSVFGIIGYHYFRRKAFEDFMEYLYTIYSG